MVLMYNNIGIIFFTMVSLYIYHTVQCTLLYSTVHTPYWIPLWNIVQTEKRKYYGNWSVAGNKRWTKTFFFLKKKINNTAFLRSTQLRILLRQCIERIFDKIACKYRVYNKNALYLTHTRIWIRIRQW